MRQVWRMLLRNPGGMIGVAILTVAIAVALFGPLLFPTSPWRMVQRPFLPPFTMANLPLGTDALGRDVMAGSCSSQSCNPPSVRSWPPLPS